MKTGIKLFPPVKGGSRSKRERRHRVALERKVSAMNRKMKRVPENLTQGDEKAVGIGTVRALERKISEKDTKIEALQKALMDIAENLTPKGKKALTEKTKVLLRMQ